MKIILIKKVENLGNPGEIKDVKPSYAYNFLIKKGFAVIPGDPKANEVMQKKKEAKDKTLEKESSFKSMAETVSGKKFVIKAKADTSGKLYGSIGPKEISKITGIPEEFINIHYKELGKNTLELNIGGEISKIEIEINKEK